DRILADGIAGEIERTTVASPPVFARPVLGMDRANPPSKTARADDDTAARADRSRKHGSGDDGPSSSKRERTVDREAEPARGLPPRKATGGIDQIRAQRIQASACHGGHGDHGRFRQRGAGKLAAYR